MVFASASVSVNAPSASRPSESVSVVAETGALTVALTVTPPEPTVTEVGDSDPECPIPAAGPM